MEAPVWACAIGARQDDFHFRGAPFTVIGVTPSEFFGMEVGVNPDIFAPLMMQPTAIPAFESFREPDHIPHLVMVAPGNGAILAGRMGPRV